MVCSGHLRLVVFARHSSISDWGRTTRKNNEWICLVVVLLSGFALPHHHPNHNSHQCVGWRQASRQRTARNIGLILGLELGLVLSAVEALHALLIAVACIQISVTDTTHEGISNLRMQFNAVRDGSLCCASPPARFSVCAAQLHAETRYVLLQAHQIELRSCRSVQLFLSQ